MLSSAIIIIVECIIVTSRQAGNASGDSVYSFAYTITLHLLKRAGGARTLFGFSRTTYGTSSICLHCNLFTAEERKVV